MNTIELKVPGKTKKKNNKKVLILIFLLTVLFVLMTLTLDLLFSKITTPLCKLLRVSLTIFVSVVRASCLRKKIKKIELYRKWVSTVSNQCEGAQWLSGRVLDSRPNGCRFEPHWRPWFVVLEQDTFILA